MSYKKRLIDWWVNFCFNKLIWPFADDASWTITEPIYEFHLCPPKFEHVLLRKSKFYMICDDTDPNGEFRKWLHED